MGYDLDKALAEDEREPFEFTFDGEQYVMPTDVGIDVIDWLNKGELSPAFEKLLGDEQWQRLVDSPKVFGGIAAGKLAEAYMQHLGLGGVGESSASSRSSASMARPSKPTLIGTTTAPSRKSEQLR